MAEFIEEHAQLVDDVGNKLLDYAKKLLAEPASPPTPAQSQPGATTTQPAVKAGLAEIEIQDGFPVMPAVHISDKVKKEELEDLMRRYLTIHYSESIVRQAAGVADRPARTCLWTTKEACAI